MYSLITDKQSDINTICYQHNVNKLYVFGSALREDFDSKHSDIDFEVQFNSGGKSPKTLKSFFNFESDLQSTLQFSNIDVVEAGAIRNAVIRNHVNQSKKLIYAS